MIVGRPEGRSAGEGVDILLPAIPWVKDAVERAQANLVDFGFGPVPALTLEDVILAKLHALQTAHIRAKDLDDLQSVFTAGKEMDLPYLAGQMRRFQITIPKTARPFLPETILRLGRDVARAMRSTHLHPEGGSALLPVAHPTAESPSRDISSSPLKEI